MLPKATSKYDSKEEYDEEADYMEEGDDYDESTEKPSSTVVKQPNVNTRQIVTQSDRNQRQHIVLDPLEDLDITVHQSKGDFPREGTVIQPGQTIPGMNRLIIKLLANRAYRDYLSAC